MIPFSILKGVPQETPDNKLTVQVTVPSVEPLRFEHTNVGNTYDDILKTRLSTSEKDEICAACVALNVSISHFVRSVSLQVARTVNEGNAK